MTSWETYVRWKEKFGVDFKKEGLKMWAGLD
jgi:hypothetical protein